MIQVMESLYSLRNFKFYAALASTALKFLFVISSLAFLITFCLLNFLQLLLTHILNVMTQNTKKTMNRMPMKEQPILQRMIRSVIISVKHGMWYESKRSVISSKMTAVFFKGESNGFLWISKQMTASVVNWRVWQCTKKISGQAIKLEGINILLYYMKIGYRIYLPYLQLRPS